MESPGSTCFFSDPTDQMNVPDLLLGPLAILAATSPTMPGAVLVLAGGIALTGLAWTKEVWLAANPLLDTLPGPRALRPRREGSE